MKELIRKSLLSVGALAVGFSEAGDISKDSDHEFKEWIENGFHGEMDYLKRHSFLRQNTRNVLEDAKTVISMAFGYGNNISRDSSLPSIASYAYYNDYHIVIRKALKPIVSDFQKAYGGNWRICIDSAPVAERFWAIKSGIGFRGKNGMVIVPEYGSNVFLTEILTSVEIESDISMETECVGCGKCLKICPAGALLGNGCIDARKCINYLTIEKKSEYSAWEKNLLKNGTGHFYGCELCSKICPHNMKGSCSPSSIFSLRPEMLTLKPEDVLSMSEDDFKSFFKDSPIAYGGYERLIRNALLLKNKE